MFNSIFSTICSSCGLDGFMSWLAGATGGVWEVSSWSVFRLGPSFQRHRMYQRLNGFRHHDVETVADANLSSPDEKLSCDPEPRLRRSNQGVTSEGLHGSSTSGANLFQEETGLRIEAQVVGLVTLARNRSRVAEQMVTTLYFFFFFHHFWRVQWVDSLA